MINTTNSHSQTPKQTVGSVNDSRLGYGWMSQRRGYHMPACSQVWLQIVDINMIIINTLPIPVSAFICICMQVLCLGNIQITFSEPVRQEHMTDRWDSLNLLLITFFTRRQSTQGKQIRIIGNQTRRAKHERFAFTKDSLTREGRRIRSRDLVRPR